MENILPLISIKSLSGLFGPAAPVFVDTPETLSISRSSYRLHCCTLDVSTLSDIS